jgi:hypothetical protein
MTVILHPPGDVSFSGDALSAEDQARIARAVHAAVLRAVQNAARGRPTWSMPDRAQGRPGGRDAQETFDPVRADLDQGIYQVPSYQGQGRLTGVELLKQVPAAEAGYSVETGRSPLDGQLLLGPLASMRLVIIQSPRYVTAGTLTQAYLLGQAVLGTSFAIMQGPAGARWSRYWAVGTEPAVAVADLAERQLPDTTDTGTERLPAELAHRTHVYVGEFIEPVIYGPDGAYTTRAFITKDGAGRWPTAAMAAVFYAQLDAERHQGVTAPPTEELRRLVFSDIDELVAQIEGGDETNLQWAAELLSGLDWRAFSLVGWEAKAGYLKVLLAASTEHEEEVAIVEIFKSLRGDSEVDAVIAMLKLAGRYDQLFDDLDDELYDLLIVVGERFPRDHGPLTFDGLVELLQGLGLLPGSIQDALTDLAVPGPVADLVRAVREGRSVPGALYDEAHDAVMGLVHTSSDLWHSVETLFTDPGQVIEGVEGLAEMLGQVYLAMNGYPPAVDKITNLLRGLGEKVLAGARGADRLGCGEKVTRRIRWRLVWEIAALFVGVGEVKAVVQAAGVSEKLAGVLRFLAVMTRLGEVVDAEVEGVRLARLAAMLKAGRSAFSSVEEAAELLARLPEEDVARLGKLVSEVEIGEGQTLAELAARSPELRAAVDDAIAKTELLKALAGKAGGLTDEIVEAFQALIADDGLPLADAGQVVSSIPDGEGARFAATLKRVPPGRLAADSRAAFLKMVAASTRRMDAVAKLGADTFMSVYRRVAGRGEMADQYLAVLDELEARLARQGHPTEFRRLLDRLEQDDAATWLEVENSRRVGAGERAISDWAAVVSGSPRAQQGLDMLLRAGHEDLVAEIMDMPDEATTLHQLELASELTPKQLDGLAAIKRAEIDFGGEMGIHDWTEILDLHPDFRNDLLDIIADVEGVVDDGLDLAVKRGFSGGTNVQGTLGHFYAARTLKDRFPGARFRFELPGAGREVDIEMSYQGRRIDVEVKTNLGREPSVNDAQIEKDLEKHIGDRWENMLYCYAPEQAGNLAAVERGMFRALRRLDARNRLPISLTEAEELLRARINASPPWKLVDVFTY